MSVIPPNAFYYGEIFKNPGRWYNTVYALNITIEQHFADLLFNPLGAASGDLNRIVYASDAYCFRERARLNGGNINIPFMNYFLKEMTPSTDRMLWNNVNTIQGMLNGPENYVSLLGDKILVVPVKLVYEAMVWFNQDQDLIYAYNKLALNNANETRLYSYLDGPNEVRFKNVAFQKLNLSYKPDLGSDENDWLEKNKITSIALDFEYDTMLIYPASRDATNPLPLSITQEAVISFLAAKNINTSLTGADPNLLIQNYFTANNLPPGFTPDNNG